MQRIELAGWTEEKGAKESGVVGLCEKMIQDGEVEGLGGVFSRLGVPALDLLVTPMTARIGLLGVMEGRGFFHHELRGAMAMPKELEPERDVWEGGTTPLWESGVREEPKYFSFFQEIPLAPYNPNYRRKWRAHEILHGLVRFFWHPQMSRFEAYLSARLNELLPVVHWYAWDEIYRPRCPQHRHRGAIREYCLACEEAARPYWMHREMLADQEAIRAAHRFAADAHEHLTSEWSICLEEVERNERIASPRGYLDGSSDAMGYLYSHWPRLTAWSFGAWHEIFLREGYDCFGSIPALMEHQKNLVQQLTHAPILWDEATMLRMLQRRLLQDCGYRSLLALEHLGEGSAQSARAERLLWPILEAMGAHVHALLDSPHDTSLDAGKDLLKQWRELCRSALPAKHTGFGTREEALFTWGLQWPDMEKIAGHTQEEATQPSLPLLREGLESAVSWLFLQGSLVDTPAALDTQAMAAFVKSDDFATHGRLLTRWARWLQTQKHLPYAWREIARFLGESQAEPRKDDEAEDFAAIPDPLDDLLTQKGTLRLHHTLRRQRWPQWLLDQILLERPPFDEQHEMDAWLLDNFLSLAPLNPETEETQTQDADTQELALIHHNASMRLLPLESEHALLLDAIAAKRPPASWLTPDLHHALQTLLDEAFVVWLPALRR